MIHYGIQTTIFGVIAVLAIASIAGLNAYAEESKYEVADGVHTIVTFTFKDGVEIVNFPVFIMEDNYVNKNISPGFSVQGVVGDSPHLHKALDEAFKYKQNPSYEWNYQLFEVDVDFVKNGETMRKLEYHDCYVKDYKVTTLKDDYESYLSSSSGFAIVDDIEFICGGLNPLVDPTNITWKTGFRTTELAHTPFTYAEDLRTFITFEFDRGIEIIEFPYFELASGFEESDDNVTPSFSVESTVRKHPLLSQAIDNARANSGIANGVNTDFEATVEFKKGDEIQRTLVFKDCRVTEALITTLFDKEEGFSGKRGFAHVEDIDFQCIGLTTKNDSYKELGNGAPVWKTLSVENVLPSHEYSMATGPKAIATFTYDNGLEVIDFGIFDQDTVLVKSNPSFVLEGLVGDYPMLYKAVDENLSLTSTTGANNFISLFNVDVELVNGDQSVRDFNYVDCRVTDYVVESQRDKEESYWKGFALSNSFEFECQGYHPNVPLYDAMFNTYQKAQTIQTGDLRDTHTWEPGFYMEG